MMTLSHLSLACIRQKCMHVLASQLISSERISMPWLSCTMSTYADKGEVRAGSGSASCPNSNSKDALQGFIRGGFSVADFPPEAIRNFCIIAHVDHGGYACALTLIPCTCLDCHTQTPPQFSLWAEVTNTHRRILSVSYTITPQN